MVSVGWAFPAQLMGVCIHLCLGYDYTHKTVWGKRGWGFTARDVSCSMETACVRALTLFSLRNRHPLPTAGYSCVHRLFLWVTCHTVNPHPSEPCSDLCIQTSPTQADLMTRHLQVWRKVLNVLSDNTVLRDRTTLCLYNHPLLPTVQRCCPVIKHVKNYFGLSQPVFNKLFWRSSICIFFHKEWPKGQKYLRCQNWNNFSVNGAALPTVCNPVFSSEPFLNPTKPVSVWIDLPLCYKVIWMKSY